jgi:hypothetical protein
MKPKTLASILLVLILGSAIAHAQVPAPPIPVEEIIKKFSEKEKSSNSPVPTTPIAR